MFLVGGHDSGSTSTRAILRYDSTTPTTPPIWWDNLPTNLYGTSVVWDPAPHPGTCPAGCVYIFGGDVGVPSSPSTTNVIWRYAPAASAGAGVVTTMTAVLPSTRDWTSAAWDPTIVPGSCPEGCAYVFGGANSVTEFNDILRYDPVSDAITVMGATFPTIRHGTSAVFDTTPRPGCPQGCAWIFGGFNNPSASFLDDVFRFDPASDTLVRVASLPSPRDETAAVWTPGGAFVFGGHNGFPRYLDQIVRVDTATAIVDLMCPSLPQAEGYIASSFDGANAFVFGGMVVGSSIPSRNLFEYDPTGAGAAPAAPTGATASGSGPYSISWTDPATLPGCPIIAYQVERHDGTGTRTIFTTSGRPYSDVGPFDGCASYDWRVRVSTRFGWSPWSASTATVAPPDPSRCTFTPIDPAPVDVTVGDNVAFCVAVDNPLGLALRVRAADAPPAANFDPSTRCFLWRPGAADIGVRVVTFAWTDGNVTKAAIARIQVRQPAGDPGPDADSDGVVDEADNCPAQANHDQADADRDGRGDACAPGVPAPASNATVSHHGAAGLDGDSDGVSDDQDNCPLVANQGQADQDRDGAGDLCDTDRDGDGILESGPVGIVLDNCPMASNTNQRDSDDDGAGDVCDPITLQPVPARSNAHAATRVAVPAESVAMMATLAALGVVVVAVPAMLVLVLKPRERQR